MSIVRVSQEIQSIHWLSVSKEACCNSYLFSVTLNFFNIWKLYHRNKIKTENPFWCNLQKPSWEI